MPIKLLAFSGSARQSSWNQQLVEMAAHYARSQNIETTVINLGDFDLPIFDEDLERESGTPDAAARLKQLMFGHQGFLISSPEYNSSIAPLLKNAIDWASRKGPDETPQQAFRGKVIGLMSASPGGLGGLRGLVHVRSIFGNLGSLVVPSQVAVGNATKTFSADGKDLTDEGLKKQLCGVVDQVIQVTSALSPRLS